MTAYYRGPDHPLKLRMWRYLRQASGYAPLVVAYGRGGWIAIDERDWLQSRILHHGAYEPEVWSALAEYATGDDVVWDVGAHIGSFTLSAAQDRRVSCVCAFEPDPHNLTRLRRNLALNQDRARVYPIALSDTPGRQTLIQGPPTNSGMSTFGPSSSTGMTQHTSVNGPSLPVHEVACWTADALIEQGRVPAPTLMKIDVEGWEYRVLEGARMLLHSRTLKAVVFEAACDAHGKVEDIRMEQLLRRFNYSLTHIERPGGERYGVENYLAVCQ